MDIYLILISNWFKKLTFLNNAAISLSHATTPRR